MPPGRRKGPLAMPFYPGPFSRRSALQRFGTVTAAAILSDAVVPSAGARGSGAKPLPRVSPETAGVSPEAVLAFLDAVEKNVGGLHSFMLLRRGSVAAEGWW